MKTRTDSSASTMSHVATSSDSPLSQASLLGSEWSCPVALDQLFCLWVPPPTISTLGPGVANDALPSAFPHMQDIPHQFSESIFTEEFCEDRPEGGAAYPAWDEATEDTCQPTLKSPEPPSQTVTSLVESPRQPSAAPSLGLHCRICLKADCDDVTATMCGHVFCNK
ncbi:hypothetical protein FIBSPDRAFT_855568 [Athelia psychrophila]|uniref:Uncharacterized protein n=1 Tax=Athelia psychrophila TaxID=1759441 RepID=A0A166P2K3_9AGAM|nr:hypothetical protein FIBSPDRAFT_855568 [Fibularhizoctonia sp. CBS 109695]